ncbi:DUF1501 domain-containing protein [Planctellipticum variicoloris]|uniref:DUF1501 domain-containing protein n=1 Tax=Planctellipticum variicoloris TaxID=3064265 RepID=UPI0030141769|nr:DUF1501 domain-containing protein [Planctomycetaceae bacterium SH412]
MTSTAPRHDHPHAFMNFNAREREGVQVFGRRSVLKASLAGLAGLSLPKLLSAREATPSTSRQKSVILIWMTGGPSHIDTWDPKPLAPKEIRGPFGVIPTALPGVQMCEFLPKQAAMLDRMTLIRSVDCRHSNHEPNMVMQTANLAAEPRENREAEKFPALASLIAKQRAAQSRELPPYVVLNMKSRSHLAWGGYLGKSYDPFVANDVGSLFALPSGLTTERLETRQSLYSDLDRLRRDLDLSGSMDAVDRFTRQATDIVLGQAARNAFDVSQESEATRQKYGSHEWCKQVLLARRLVESGVSFVTIDLSNHGASGTWDTHGDNIPPYGGIWNGLRPLLPVFDHLITTLVEDLGERGLLDDVLVLAMGEFGRTPQIGTQGSSDGRNHWPVVMSMTVAGGGLRHGQVIGATERDGGNILERPVTPGDLAATIFRHMGVPQDLSYLDNRGRPRPVIENGAPIAELG